MTKSKTSKTSKEKKLPQPVRRTNFFMLAIVIFLVLISVYGLILLFFIKPSISTGMRIGIEVASDFSTIVSGLLVTIMFTPPFRKLFEPYFSKAFPSFVSPRFVFTFGLCLIVAIEGHAFVNNLPGFLTTVQVEGKESNVLVAYSDADVIWQVEFSAEVANAVAKDLDGDGIMEVIAGIGMDEKGVPSDDTGYLFVYDGKGNLLDKRNLWKRSIYPGGASDQVRVVDFEVATLIPGGSQQIVVISDDTYWFASKVSTLSFEEKKLVENDIYWNPGLLYTVDIADLEGDGIQEVVVTGMNNHLMQEIPELDGNVAVVFLLKGDQMKGQAPPSWSGWPAGNESWYMYVLPRTTKVDSIVFQDVVGNSAKEIHVRLRDTCSFYLQENGDVVALGTGSACTKESQLVPVEKH